MLVRTPWFWLHLLASVACGLFPITRVLGYEHALGHALVVPFWAPFVGARFGRVTPWQTRRLVASIGLSTAALGGGLLPTLALQSALGSCNTAMGLLFFALMPWSSALVATAIGWLLGSLTHTLTARATWSCIGLFVIVSFLLMLARLYFEPPIVLFDPLWGYFAGSLYDEAIVVPQALWATRATSACMVLAVAAVGWAVRERHVNKTILAAASLATLALQCLVVERRFGSRIDHRTIEQHLSCTIVRPGLVLHLPQHTPPEKVRAITQDHLFRLHSLSHRMGTAPTQVLHSYVYASARQKRQLMGGANTMIARPWLHEIHIHGLEVPHPLLAHEMVHALAAPWAGGALKVSARYGVLLNMGLIEGLAVALAPDGLGPPLLTAAQELYGMGLNAPLFQLMGGPQHFWRLAPARAYTQAGALLRYLEQRFGIAFVRKLYRSGSPEEALGMDWHALEADFTSWLKAGPKDVGEAVQDVSAATMAKASLAVPSLFSRSCPHEVARRRQLAQGAKGWLAVDLWRDCASLSQSDADVLALARALHRVNCINEARSHTRRLCDQPRGAPGSTTAQACLLWAQLSARQLLATQPDVRLTDVPSQIAQTCRRAQMLAPWQSVDGDAWLTLWAMHEPQPQALQALTTLLGDHANDLAPRPHVQKNPSAMLLDMRQLFLQQRFAELLALAWAQPAHPYGPLRAEQHYLVSRAAMNLEAWSKCAAAAEELGQDPDARIFVGWAQDAAARAHTELLEATD